MSLLYTQWFHRPHYPVQSFAGKTIIVTGGNIGLGKEACKHFTRLGAEKVILASRSLSNGRSAKTEIERETKRANVVEVWELDLSSYASTQAFAKRAETLPRIDAAIMNASVQTLAYSEAEGVELSLTVNVISTFLLAFMLLPLLRASAEKYDIKPVLNIVSSDLAGGAKVPEHKGANVFEVLSDETTANMMDRYVLT
jgi:retinol dehydrogenase-12